MEPAVKPAAAATRNGVVGVLATTGTIGSTRFSALLARFADGIEVISRPSPELVELVERGDLHSVHARTVVRHCLEPLLARGADTVILGCTHFPPLRPLIEEIVGPRVAIIDTGAAVARQVQRRLAESGSLRTAGQGEVRAFVTGAVENAASAIHAVWGETLEAAALILPEPPSP
jgi:glutamate racemase